MNKRLLAIFSCVLVLLPLWVFGQQIVTINGQITDEVGNPLPGANVYIRGTSFGAAADVEGGYSFNAPATGQEVTIVARYMGYKSKSATITLSPGTITQDFKLNTDVLELEEVVVTGMGVGIQKEKLGVTIAKVKPKLVQEADQPNIVSALHGKVSNVEIVKTSGDPGTNTFIRIRGVGSIDRTTQPLFVVDGSPIDNSTLYTNGAYNSGTEPTNRAGDINSEDIESIEVLKGAAASAIYGSRAANGVVLITTKSGRPGKTKISFKSSWGLTEMSNTYPLQTWYSQGQRGIGDHTNARSWGRLLNVPGAPHYKKGYLANEPDDKVYDHAREASDGGWSGDNNITISGGNNLTTFFASFGHFYEKGHWEAGSDYERYTARVKASQVISDNLKLTGNIAYVRSDQNALQRGDNLAGIALGMLRSPPDFNNLPYLDPVTGYHRSYRYQSAEELRRSRSFNNPFWIMYEQIDVAKLDRVFGNATLDFDPFKFLNVSYTLGSDSYIDDRLSVRPIGDAGADGQGWVGRDNYKVNQIDGNLVATFQANRLFENLKDINASFLLGHNFNIREHKRLRATGTNMAVEGFNQLDNCVDIIPNEYEYRIHTESYFGQATIDMFDQLYLTGAIRNEGSTTFGKAQKRHWYPKASAAWEFTKFQTIPYLSFGKIRFAYGQAGVQPGVYSTLSGYATGSRGYGPYTNADLMSSYYGKMGYYSSSSPPNDAIKPERTAEYEVGANLAFWNNRIGLEVTYYNATARDVLFDVNLVPSTGYFDRTDNPAVIVNKGWETTLDLNPIKMRNFSWNLTVNWSRNRNMVKELPVVYEDISRFGVASAGHPMNEYYIPSWIRFGYGEIVDGVNIDEAYAGQWNKNDVYIQENGYPKMSTNYYFSGYSSNPDWTGSIRSEFTLFNNLTISGLIDIVDDYYIMNHGAGALYSYGTHKDTENRWHPDYEEMGVDWGHGPISHFFEHGEKGLGPGVDNGAANDVKYTESWYRGDASGFSGDMFLFIDDASYVKLREIAIAYTIRHPWISWFGLSDIRIRLSGNNLITWTPYDGWDPETNRRQATGERGGDYFNQPQVRSYNMTLYFNL